MDASTKKACFAEITHQICDADAKVNITELSANWSVPLRAAERLLWDWIEHSAPAADRSHLHREFIVRGCDPQGHGVISVIQEQQLPAVQRMLPGCTHSLFSLERLAAAAQSPRLGMHQLSTGTVVDRPIEPKMRECQASTSAVSSATTNSTHKPAAAPKVETKSIEAKPSTSSSAHPSPPKTAKIEPKTPNKLPTPPKHTSPKRSAPKAAAAPAAGKAAITAFFSKPGAAKTAAEKPKPIVKDVPQPDEEPTTNVSVKRSASPKASTTAEKRPKHADEVAASRKRSLADLVDSDHDEEDDDMDADSKAAVPSAATPASKRKRTAVTSAAQKPANGKQSTVIDSDATDDDIPGTPQPQASDASKSRANSKTAASRVRQIVDSSDDEQMPETKPPAAAAAAAANGRRKAKRMVTRTFEDEDGYIKTVKETEEYTCSEDDEAAVAEVKPPPKASTSAAHANGNGTAKPAAAPKAATKVSLPAAAAKKKVSPPAGKAVSAKQGSIMSFFKKK